MSTTRLTDGHHLVELKHVIRSVYWAALGQVVVGSKAGLSLNERSMLIRTHSRFFGIRAMICAVLQPRSPQAAPSRRNATFLQELVHSCPTRGMGDGLLCSFHFGCVPTVRRTGWKPPGAYECYTATLHIYSVVAFLACLPARIAHQPLLTRIFYQPLSLRRITPPSAPEQQPFC